jgi:hypothetical protein
MLDIIWSTISSETFWVAVGSIGALITLILIYYQIKTSSMVAAADFILKLERSFHSKKMLATRRKLVQTISQNPKDFKQIESSREVIDFFDDLGVLVSKKVIPVELAWSAFCYWVLPYWTMTHYYVDWCRKSEKDPNYYADFEYLHKCILKYEEKQRHRKVEPTKKQLKEFADEEMRL